MTRFLVINGSYRPGGTVDQALAVAVETASATGAEIEVVHLRDHPIGFCRNCRACTQMAGDTPGRCVQDDGMAALIESIEAADAYILASPTNFHTVTALFKRFMERLLVYAWWPWGRPGPKMRRTRATRKAILIASCAAPSLIGRLFYGTMRQLEATAQTLGAQPVGRLFIGLAGSHEHPELDQRTKQRVRSLATKLIRSS